MEIFQTPENSPMRRTLEEGEVVPQMGISDQIWPVITQTIPEFS